MKRLLLTLAFPAAAGFTPAFGEEKINFADHVRPILESACLNCHNPDKKKGGLDLTTYVATMTGGSSGEVVTSGNSADSRLHKSIIRPADPAMPPQGSPLSAKEVEIIAKWINGGLLETATGVAKKAKKPAFDMQIASVGTGKPEGPPPMPENLLLEPVVRTSRASATAAMASSPWAPLVAISGQHQVLLYNTDTLELAGVLPYKEGFVESLNFSRNSQLLCAGGGRPGKNGKVVVWDVKSGRRVIEVGEELDTVLASDISADQVYVAIGDSSRRVKIYNTATNELVKDIKKHTDWVTAAQFSPDGVLLASGDRAGGLFVWEAKSGSEFYTLSGHTGGITAVTWRDDANIVASASEDGTIRLWEMNEGKEVKKWNHGGPVLSLNFTHDGRLVSCGRDYKVKVFGQDGAQQAEAKDFADLPQAACFSNDGSKFIVGDWSGAVSVWNAKDAKKIGEMSAAPPTIDERLAVLKPEMAKTESTMVEAKTAMGSMASGMAEVQGKMDKSKGAIMAFSTTSAEVEKTLAGAKAAAAELLARLNTPMPATPPAPDPAKPSMDMGTAVALAKDYKALVETAKTSVGGLSGQIGGMANDFKAMPGQIAGHVQAVKSSEATVAEMQKKQAEAQKTVEAAAAALDGHKKSVARWEAAKVNVTIFQRREELAKLTAKLEEAAADLADREKVIASTPAALAAAPEPEKAALQKKLDAANAGLAELKKSKADLDAQVASTKTAIDAETAKYLSMLPK